MKVIAIGDPHFRTDNIPEVNQFMDKLENLCKEEKPNFIVVLGDVLHTHERLHTMPLNKAYEFISRLRVISKTFILVGNHDMTSNQNFLNTNHWMNAMKEWNNVTVVDKIEFYKIKNFLFTFVPYVPPGRFVEALESDKSYDWKESDCIFAHQEFAGCKMGAIVSSEGDKWDENNPYIISGHIHSNQSIGENIYYPGSSMQHAFGESDRNIIPLIEFNKGYKYSLEEIDLGLPRKKIVYTDIEKIDKIDSIIRPESEDKVKITMSGVYDDFKAFKKTTKYRELIKKGVKVVFKPKKIENKEMNNKETDNKENNNESSLDCNNFAEILNGIIMKEKNNYLYQVYEQIVNDKVIDDDEFLII
jgi:DNA repair exonuclease SbcCD nuclease subunit